MQAASAPQHKMLLFSLLTLTLELLVLIVTFMWVSSSEGVFVFTCLLTDHTKSLPLCLSYSQMKIFMLELELLPALAFIKGKYNLGSGCWGLYFEEMN